jgi:hypothetical protein
VGNVATGGARRIRATRGTVQDIAAVRTTDRVALAWCTLLDNGRVAYGLIAVDEDGRQQGGIVQLGTSAAGEGPCSVWVEHVRDTTVRASFAGRSREIDLSGAHPEASSATD